MRSPIIVVISWPVISIMVLGWSSSLWRSMVVTLTVVVVVWWRSIAAWVVGWWSIVPVTMGTWGWMVIVTTVVSTTPPRSWSLLWLFCKKQLQSTLTVSLIYIYHVPPKAALAASVLSTTVQ